MDLYKGEEIRHPVINVKLMRESIKLWAEGDFEFGKIKNTEREMVFIIEILLVRPFTFAGSTT
jgi:hypothetical protein